MIEYEILTDSEILIWIPSGKDHEGEPGFYYDQKGTVSDTCFYYCFNYLRKRYGKNAPQDDNRTTEMLISEYRKRLTQINRSRSTESFLINTIKQIFHKNNISKSDAWARYQHLSMLNKNAFFKPNAQQVQILNFEANFIKDFLEQTKFDDIAEYSKEKAVNKSIEAHEDLLMAFNSDMHSIVFAQEAQLSPDPEQAALSPTERVDLLGHEAAIFEICKQYNIGFSSWKPDDGFDSLFNILRDYGPQGVNGIIGTPFYIHNGRIAKIDKQEFVNSRKLFELDENHYTDESVDTHMILIIGAARKAQGNVIYFIDPAESNKVEAERIVYQMDYDHFISKISSSIDPHDVNRKFYLYYNKEHERNLANVDNNAVSNDNNNSIFVR